MMTESSTSTTTSSSSTSSTWGSLLTGDFGQTFSGTRVGDLIATAVPDHRPAGARRAAIEAVIGLTAGILTGLRGRGFLDNLVLVSTLFLIALPVFVTGFVLQIVLGFQLGHHHADRRCRTTPRSAS